MFDRLAEVANQYLSKGSKAYIEGKLKTREWEKDGAKRSTTEIVANKLQMLDSKQQKENFDEDIPF
jgi:single-strand DNA-binding protein